MDRRFHHRLPWRQFSLRTLVVLMASTAFIALSYAVPRRTVPFEVVAGQPVFLSGESWKSVRATIVPAFLFWYAGWAIAGYSYGYDRTRTRVGAKRGLRMSIVVGSIVLSFLQATNFGPLRFFH